MAMDEISVDLDLKIPFTDIGFKIGGKWKPDESERRAAWELYVELVTRISVAELRPGEGLLREALSSLYSLFATTRGILRSYGPGIAQPKLGDSDLSFGYIAVTVLNVALRPVLSTWHPRLADWEAKKPADRSAMEHEQAWAHAEELRAGLNTLREELIDYANLLADAARVPSLIVER